MGLIGKLFGSTKDKDAAQPPSLESTQFHESEASTTDEIGSRNATKRELVQVMLRDTMRKHGIPSDWIECRILSADTRSRRTGLHVQFIVREAHDRLLAYVFAFQDTFQREVQRLDPRYGDWLLSVGWVFEGQMNPHKLHMPDPKVWAGAAGAAALASTGEPAASPAPAASTPPEVPTGFEPTQDPLEEDDDVARDLQALFAIRDAALSGGEPAPDPGEHPDFEPTRPGFDEPDLPRR